jgi:hypothetical protein
MRKFIVISGLLLVLVNTSIAQHTGYSINEFKPLHGLSGLWKMDTERGTIYEEWQVRAK